MEAKTKKIFLLRHAEYLSGRVNSGLSDYGRSQAKNLAERIKREINDAPNVTIFTSTANRAKETALIIKESLTNAVLIEYEKLWSDGSHIEDLGWLRSKIKNFDGDILIIISHLEYVNYLPEKLGFCMKDAGYAQGVLIKDDECIDF